MSSRVNVVDVIAGTTLKTTFVNSGAAADFIGSALRDRSETIVNSVAAVSSGNGFYYALHAIPNSAQWFVNEWVSVFTANTYVNRQLVHVHALEVD